MTKFAAKQLESITKGSSVVNPAILLDGLQFTFEIKDICSRLLAQPDSHAIPCGAGARDTRHTRCFGVVLAGRRKERVKMGAGHVGYFGEE